MKYKKNIKRNIIREVQTNKIFLIKYFFLIKYHYIINYVTYNFKNDRYILLQYFNKYLKFI